MTDTDPVELTARLIRCASVTPEDAGAMQVVADALAAAGFTCVRADRGGVANLVARWGAKGHPRTFGFNGHVDVVPPGDPAAWSLPPFAGQEHEGALWGRGAADMKSGVAAFVAAAAEFVRNAPPEGALIVTITGDEEGEATDGTVAILDWMDETGERMDVCLVGEPTCPERMGEMIKIGRRGSLTAWLEAVGVQGHAAYPHRARNPVAALARLVDQLSSAEIDTGTKHFDASTLAAVAFDTGNPATNVIPATARATINIRFNDLHTGRSLTRWLESHAAEVSAQTGVAISVRVRVSGEAFLTPPGPLSDLVAGAVEAETGVVPVLSTSGGTSDARFIRAHCPVVEFGLVGATMHKVDERVEVDHIRQLKRIYARILADYFAG